MRVPQVSDRIKEVPAQALRGVFAGIGQVLLITDRLRNKTPAHQQVPQARGPERSETAAEAPGATQAPPASPAPSVSPVSPASPAEQAPPAPRVETAPRARKAAPASPADRAASQARDLDKTGNVRLLGGTGAGARDVAKITNAEDPGAGVAREADVPVPNYDELTVASLRARLRNLDAAQVKQLAEYERAHAARADVIAMFERRIAKLEAERQDQRGEAEAEAEKEAQEDVAAEVQEEVGAEAEGEA